MDERNEIYKAITKAQALHSGVAKGSRNDFAKYDYASAEDTVSSCKPVLAECDLGVVRIESLTLEHATRSVFRVVHGASGQSLDIVFDLPNGAQKVQDKATLASYTTALSYCLRDLFLIPRVDGLEVDSIPYTPIKETRAQKVGTRFLGHIVSRKEVTSGKRPRWEFTPAGRISGSGCFTTFNKSTAVEIRDLLDEDKNVSFDYVTSGDFHTIKDGTIKGGE